MRSLRKSWIGIILAILFMASIFLFRGASRYSNLFNSDNIVASVSGTPISTTKFLRSLEMNIGQFAQMIGEELSGDQIRAFQIHELVLQNLVNNAIFENEFDNLNYILDDTIIAEKTKSRFPNLYINNKINDDALNNFLRQQRLKIEDLVNIINYETRADIFDSLFFEKNYPNEITKKINLFDLQSRYIELAKIDYEKIKLFEFNKKNIKKDDPELVSYFEENKIKYMSQEKRDFSYIVINKEDYKENFIPDQNEISNYFQKNKNIYAIPEKRSFKQFNFKSKKEAEDFKVKISNLPAKSQDIDKLASDENIIFNKFEDLDSNQVLDELSKVIFSLNENEISEVVSTTLAHHIIILEKIIPSKEPKFNEVYDKIRDTLINVQLDNFFNDLKLKINQQIFDGLSLKDLALENNLLVFNKVDTVLNDSSEDIFLNTITNEAFSQNKDFVSDVYDFNNNQSFIINVDEIYPSKVENLDNVIENVLSDYIKSKKLIYANEQFEKAKLNNSLSEIKNTFNINLEEIIIKLNSNDLPNSVKEKIFDTKLNEITFSSDENSVYFAKINKIEMPKEIKTYSDINLMPELKKAFGNGIIKTKNISFNDELINGLLSQYK